MDFSQLLVHLTSHKYLTYYRLLEWDDCDVFTCSTCQNALAEGQMIDIVCDGIMMGCKRHYMQDVMMDKPENDTPIKGTKHSDR